MAGVKGVFKYALGGFLGLCTGGVAMYSKFFFDQVVKPTKPVANFAVAADGLTVTCDNKATGDSGFWDFGDGTALEPFAPDQQAVKHTYDKPGSYSIKLKVRNFLLEENERGVPVTIAAASPNALPPLVKALAVAPINGTVAPAAYRITGEVQGADELILVLGDKTEVVSAEAGPFERTVVFETPGRHPVALVAKAGKKADMKAQTADVTPPTVDTLLAVCRVTDAVARVDRRPMVETFTAPLTDRKGPTKGVSRVIQARPGYTIVDAKIDAKRTPPFIKNLKAVIDPKDKRSVHVTGDWDGSPEALSKKAGGQEPMVVVNMIEERTLAADPVHQEASGTIDHQTGKIVMKLPPSPMPGQGVTRKVEVEVWETKKTGERVVLARGVMPASGPWSGTVPFKGSQFTAKAELANGQVAVSFFAAGPPPQPTGRR